MIKVPVVRFGQILARSIFFIRLTATSLAIIMSGCIQRSDNPQPEHLNPPLKTTTPAADTWTRMKDCTAQSERLAKERNWAEGKRIESGASILGWQNHYSDKYQRCYVGISYVMRSGSGNKYSFWYSELIDAFEARTLAANTTSSLPNAKNNFCYVEGDNGSLGDCAASGRFMDDHMKY